MDWKAVIEEETARLRNQLATAVRDLDGDVDTDVTVGSASAELEDLSRSVDLLVIGSRRWGAIARVVNGSTGEALLHGGACCPVVLVPRPRVADA